MRVQDIVVEDTFIYGQPAGVQAVAAANGTFVYASPPFEVWQWPAGPPFMADGVENSADFARGFLSAGPVLEGIEMVRMTSMHASMHTAMHVAMHAPVCHSVLSDRCREC